MTAFAPRPPFQPQAPDAAGVLSWVHIGDLHMTRPGEQNDLDLQAIVHKINQFFASSLAFVFLPGDVADDGSRAAYAVVRRSLDQLSAPWCAILGDHDVHEKSFANFLEAMAPRTYYAFTAGNIRFLALNAFDIPEPPSFTVSSDQLHWAEQELQQATQASLAKVLLLHCYPSDLKVGGEALTRLIRDFSVRLVDMGHTHYNEVANDGHTLYTATRSTGQIEEGPVGFSITNLDGDAISWRFIELDQPTTVIITSPPDIRLTPHGDPSPHPQPEQFAHGSSTQPEQFAHGSSTRLQGQRPGPYQPGATSQVQVPKATIGSKEPPGPPIETVSGNSLTVRAKIWSESPIVSVTATLGQASATLAHIPGTQLWQGTIWTSQLPDQPQALRVVAHTQANQLAQDEIRIAQPAPHASQRAARDQDNQIGAWPEHGLLGTQLGPNKNGKKW